MVGDVNYLCRVHTDSVARDDEAKKTGVGASPTTPLVGQDDRRCERRQEAKHKKPNEGSRPRSECGVTITPKTIVTNHDPLK